jgi:hypothetical protein
MTDPILFHCLRVDKTEALGERQKHKRLSIDFPFVQNAVCSFGILPYGTDSADAKSPYIKFRNIYLAAVHLKISNQRVIAANKTYDKQQVIPSCRHCLFLQKQTMSCD